MSGVRLTQELGAFVSGLDASKTPLEARARAITGFIDCVGVMVAGAKEDAPFIMRDFERPNGGRAILWPDGQRATPAAAALINGIAAHALDYDDTGLKGHPSAVMVPAILAMADELRISGSRLVTAYLAGYETWGELIYREADQHATKGWHITGIFGAIAAAAACASLRGLDAGKTATALALAASQSAGLLSNFGTMAKPMHAGLAARTGVFSAELAALGMTASADALEHPQGFLAAVSPAGRIDVTSPVRAGREWRMLSVGLNVKKFPMCYATHRAIDAARDLKAKYGLTAADIESVEVAMSARNATILRHHVPKEELEAKFSIEFAMASAFTAGDVGLREVKNEFVRRPDIQAFFPRVRTRADVESDPLTGHSRFDQVDLRLFDGRSLSSGEVIAARGAASLPLTRDELFDKFSACLEMAASALDAEELFDRLSNLDDLKQAQNLYAVPADATA
jgi:2-methylcitrate dehydratase PrpD